MPLDILRQIVARWPEPSPAHIPLLKQANIEVVIVDPPSAEFERACGDAGIAVAPSSVLNDAFAEGLWPGIRGGPNQGSDDETASASREPWIDANGYLIAFQRALHVDRRPILAYRPDEKAGLSNDRMVPFQTLEIALAEARVAGGNYILSLEPRYRAALLSGDAKATAAWKQLGATAGWCRAHADLFGRSMLPQITMLVEEGEATQELANIAYRRNCSPSLAPAAKPPAPDPQRILCLSAASIKAPQSTVRARILAHAEAGATVVVDEPGEKAWWRDRRLKHVKEEGDRDVFALGKGRVVAYRETVLDPSEFSLDLIDFTGQKQRPVRLWNASTVIPLATAGRKAGEALLHLVNYGSPFDREIQARIQGLFSKATLLRPGMPAAALQTARRGTSTEVFPSKLGSVATVVFG